MTACLFQPVSMHFRRVGSMQLLNLSRLHHPINCGRDQPEMSSAAVFFALPGVLHGVHSGVSRVWFSASGWMLSKLTDQTKT